MRYSELNKPEYEELKTIGIEACVFFNPLNYECIMKKMGRESSKKGIKPLSAKLFYEYLSKKDNKYEKKIHKIQTILHLLENNDILIREPYVSNSAMLPGSYYFLKELSTCQSNSSLWLGSAFGVEYIKNELKENVVHITGKNEWGDIKNGTGFLINKKTVLTCKHVIEDMNPDEKILIQQEEYRYEIKKHEKKDIALLILDHDSKISTFPAFNNGKVLDEVLVMGYPPISLADDAYLLSQKGEANAVVNLYLNKTKCLIVSCITHPGNSGGPVLSRDGYMVGMIIELTDKMESTEDEKKLISPYYMAIEGKELYDGILEIDKDTAILFEDYQ